jgi:hypothetical protein
MEVGQSCVSTRANSASMELELLTGNSRRLLSVVAYSEKYLERV